MWMKKYSVSSTIKQNVLCCVHVETGKLPILPWPLGPPTKGALGGPPADQVAGATFGCQLAPPVNFFSPAFH